MPYFTSVLYLCRRYFGPIGQNIIILLTAAAPLAMSWSNATLKSAPGDSPPKGSVTYGHKPFGIIRANMRILFTTSACRPPPTRARYKAALLTHADVWLKHMTTQRLAERALKCLGEGGAADADAAASVVDVAGTDGRAHKTSKTQWQDLRQNCWNSFPARNVRSSIKGTRLVNHAHPA